MFKLLIWESAEQKVMKGFNVFQNTVDEERIATKKIFVKMRLTVILRESVVWFPLQHLCNFLRCDASGMKTGMSHWRDQGARSPKVGKVQLRYLTARNMTKQVASIPAIMMNLSCVARFSIKRMTVFDKPNMFATSNIFLWVPWKKREREKVQNVTKNLQNSVFF